MAELADARDLGFRGRKAVQVQLLSPAFVCASVPQAPAKPAANAPTPPVAILHGPERFLQVELTGQLREALVARHGEVNTLIFDGASAKATDVLDECRSMSLMQCHKLVIVDNTEVLLKGGEDEESGDGAPAPPPMPGKRGAAGGGKSARELFLEYALAPDPGATLLLRAGGRWYPGKLDKAAIAASGPAAVRKCEEFKSHEAVPWTIARAASHHTTIDREAATLLVETIGPDLGRLDSELAKLAMWEVGKPINAAAVSTLSAITRQEAFYTIQEALASGDAERALSQLRELREVSRHNEVPIMSSFIDLARKMMAVRQGLMAREPVPSIMGRLRLFGPGSGAIIEAAKRLSPDDLAELFRLGVDAARKHRSGLRDPVLLLEELTIRFAGVFAGQPMKA